MKGEGHKSNTTCKKCTRIVRNVGFGYEFQIIPFSLETGMGMFS